EVVRRQLAGPELALAEGGHRRSAAGRVEVGEVTRRRGPPLGLLRGRLDRGKAQQSHNGSQCPTTGGTRIYRAVHDRAKWGRPAARRSRIARGAGGPAA